jgi:hypothetical protein
MTKAIRASKRARLVTINIYVPPAYGRDGEPLRESTARG